MDLDSIRPSFEKVSVTSALVIDDAFDPMPALEDDDLQAGYRLVEADGEVEEAYKTAGGAWPADFAAFAEAVQTDEPLSTLLRHGLVLGRGSPLGKLANTLFGTQQRAYADKRSPLEALVAVLKELGIKAQQIGSTEKVPGTNHPLIFLDYFLGDEGQPAVDRSVEKIKGIVDRYGEDERPLVVLMSSIQHPPETIEQFRQRADLLGCQFMFVNKDKFTKATIEFVSTLADQAEFLPQARTVGRFVRQWKKALADAVTSVSEDVATLDLQDFYFIWKKAGEGKNDRFGDHVTSLFEGLLRRTIEEGADLAEAASAMSVVSFGKMPPNPLVPSLIVARMAHAAAFRDLPPFEEGVAKVGGKLGIDLGELFISERRIGRPRRRVLEAQMVISQACDLEHGKTGTVLLVEGTVHERSAATRADTGDIQRRLRIDIFQFRNDRDVLEDLIIEWDAKRLIALSADTFHKTMADKGFERVGRLRPLHALAMQQKFAADLTRVGMPDALPVYRYGTMDVRVASGQPKETTKPLTFKKAGERAVCVVGEDDKTLLILASELEKVRSALSTAKPDDFAEGAVEALRAELGDIAKFRRLLQAPIGRGEKQLGRFLVRDKSEPLPADFKLPDKVLGVISFTQPG